MLILIILAVFLLRHKSLERNSASQPDAPDTEQIEPTAAEVKASKLADSNQATEQGSPVVSGQTLRTSKPQGTQENANANLSTEPISLAELAKEYVAQDLTSAWESAEVMPNLADSGFFLAKPILAKLTTTDGRSYEFRSYASIYVDTNTDKNIESALIDTDPRSCASVKMADGDRVTGVFADKTISYRRLPKYLSVIESIREQYFVLMLYGIPDLDDGPASSALNYGGQEGSRLFLYEKRNGRLIFLGQLKHLTPPMDAEFSFCAQ
ncbi:MAG: hypothetical protein C5B49_02030 [Bdellovibrio sp.]|nr:MAG: hypothetical protein C5B49_02030 [Bdellovibrio sp.]